MDKKIYLSMNYNSEQNQINMFNQYGPMFTIAKKDERGKWQVDVSEVDRTVVSPIANDLERELNDKLNQEELSNSQLHHMLETLRDHHNV